MDVYQCRIKVRRGSLAGLFGIKLAALSSFRFRSAIALESKRSITRQAVRLLLGTDLLLSSATGRQGSREQSLLGGCELHYGDIDSYIYVPCFFSTEP